MLRIFHTYRLYPDYIRNLAEEISLRDTTARHEDGLLDVFHIPKSHNAAFQHNSRSPLLSLPKKLRTMIWTAVFDSRSPLPIWALPKSESTLERAIVALDAPPDPTREQQARLRTCRLPQVSRAIYAETASVVYSRTDFSIHLGYEGRLWNVWIALRLPYQISAIQRLGVFAERSSWPPPALHKKVDVPDAAFTGLKVLTVSCECLILDVLGERYPGWRDAYRRGGGDGGFRISVGF